MNKESEARSAGRFLHNLGISFLLILISSVLGIGLLVLSEFVPVDRMERNLSRSAQIFRDTGKYPSLYTWCSSRLDNDSDAKMLMMAGSVSSEYPVENAVMSRRGIIGDWDPVQIITAHYLDGKDYDGTADYPRYWHGYKLLYRPLLLFFDYHRIRQINLVCQAGLAGLVCLMMFRFPGKGKGMILPLLISYGMMMPSVIGRTLEYSPGLYISLLSVLVLLLLYRKGNGENKAYLVFLFSGILTTYWDVFVYPMAALGFPLVVVLYLSEEKKVSGSLIRLIRLVFFWGLGYSVMWVLKWTIGSILTGSNLFADGLETIAFRTSSEADGIVYTAFQTISLNLQYFFRTPVSFLFLAFLMTEAALLMTRMPKNAEVLKTMGTVIFPYVLIMCIPLVWYAVTKNHATIHYWFTNKALIVSTMALMCGMDELRKTLTDPAAKKHIEAVSEGKIK